MKKIPTVFKRDPENMKRVLPEINSGCEWVLADEGRPTRKFDGTCMKKEAGTWWARREVKPGKVAPSDFVAEETDPNTDKTVGWIPVETSAFVKFWSDALDCHGDDLPDDTYELIGPCINGNPENIDHHCLVPHGAQEIDFHFTGDPASAYDYFKSVLTDEKFQYEGIVWHHPDGRMAKLKVRDFR